MQRCKLAKQYRPFKIFEPLVSLILFFDGSCEPVNPNGNIGAGVIGYEAENFTYMVFKKPERKFKTEHDSIKTIHKDSRFFEFGSNGFEKTSNNQAEHLALNVAMEYSKTKDYKTIFFFGDSQLIIRQMCGDFSINEGKTYYHYAKKNIDLKNELEQAGKKLHFFWIPRELNYVADRLSKKN